MVVKVPLEFPGLSKVTRPDGPAWALQLIFWTRCSWTSSASAKNIPPDPHLESSPSVFASL